MLLLFWGYKCYVLDVAVVGDYKYYVVDVAAVGDYKYYVLDIVVFSENNSLFLFLLFLVIINIMF